MYDPKNPHANHTSPAEHRDYLNKKFVELNGPKYDRGQAEHGGELYKKDCSAFMLEEVSDFWNYTVTEADNKKRVMKILEQAETYPSLANVACRDALEILRGTLVDKA